MTRPRRTAALAGPLFALSSVVLASGCAVFSEQTTQRPYTPSDGAQTDVGDLQVRNLMFVAQDAQSPASLVGVFLNVGSEDLEVTLTSQNGVDATFDVPAGGSVSVGPDGDEAVEVEVVGVVPGRTTPVSVDDGASEPVPVDTPVLDGALPEYADLVPTGS